jgi:gamma-glutamylcyclotransferase (GGCT)/AIG2-like uncharacterized protein YtfP
MEIYYFAYGSNMSEKRMINRGLTPLSKQIGILENYKFIINKKSYKNPELGFANVMLSEKDNVEGIVYKVLESDIKKLDKFEGFPKHYTKELLTIRLFGGELVQAIVYIANPNWVSETVLKSTTEYKNYILEGINYISKNYYKFLNENIKV